MSNELPKLQTKQQNFVMHYVANGMDKPSEAYLFAYDCENMSKEAIAVEAQKLLKNPKVTLWVNYAKENFQKTATDELKYSLIDCFNEIDDMKKKALKCSDKYDNPNVGVALKAVELKGKLAGHFVEKHQVTGENLADVLSELK